MGGLFLLMILVQVRLALPRAGKDHQGQPYLHPHGGVDGLPGERQVCRLERRAAGGGGGEGEGGRRDQHGHGDQRGRYYQHQASLPAGQDRSGLSMLVIRQRMNKSGATISEHSISKKT